MTAISDLVHRNEIVELTRELEFQGSKLVADYFQEILENLININLINPGKLSLISNEYLLNIPNDQLKDMISANVISGFIMLEIIGSNVIGDLNRDWTAAGAFIECFTVGLYRNRHFLKL